MTVLVKLVVANVVQLETESSTLDSLRYPFGMSGALDIAACPRCELPMNPEKRLNPKNIIPSLSFQCLVVQLHLLPPSLGRFQALFLPTNNVPTTFLDLLV